MKTWLDSRGEMWFFLGLLLAASGLLSPSVGLAVGVLFGLTVAHPLARQSGALAKILLQISVVGLGFGMNLREVVQAGRSGFGYTALSITVAMTLGLLLGRSLMVGQRISFLITAGTAICGGSAIAALAPVSEASEEEITAAMGSVFVLNSVALVLFPLLGAYMHFTQNQFGLWAALAIHDTSSVVGAAAKFGPQALAVGTTVKLVRALWIVPLTLLTSVVVRRRAEDQRGSRGGVTLPWFIGFFCLASLAGTYLPRFAVEWKALNNLGHTGLTATLYLIGTTLSVATLRRVGVRPFVQGVALWVIVGSVSAWAIHAGWIGV